MIAFASNWPYAAAFQMHFAQFEKIIRDAEVAACIAPVVWKHGLSEEETTTALLELRLPRAANIARICCSLKRP
jgi:hypothetical protein